jgi:hypothetical protein
MAGGPPAAALAAQTRRQRPQLAGDAPGRPRRARNGPVKACPEALRADPQNRTTYQHQRQARKCVAVVRKPLAMTDVGALGQRLRLNPTQYQIESEFRASSGQGYNILTIRTDESDWGRAGRISRGCPSQSERQAVV